MALQTCTSSNLGDFGKKNLPTFKYGGWTTIFHVKLMKKIAKKKILFSFWALENFQKMEFHLGYLTNFSWVP